MSQCTNRYLSTCNVPARMSRDGYAGANANIYIPFAGIYFFSGATMSFAGANIPQDRSRAIAGVTKEGHFTKGFVGQCGA